MHYIHPSPIHSHNGTCTLLTWTMPQFHASYFKDVKVMWNYTFQWWSKMMMISRCQMSHFAAHYRVNCRVYYMGKSELGNIRVILNTVIVIMHFLILNHHLKLGTSSHHLSQNKSCSRQRAWYLQKQCLSRCVPSPAGRAGWRSLVRLLPRRWWRWCPILYGRPPRLPSATKRQYQDSITSAWSKHRLTTTPTSS